MRYLARLCRCHHAASCIRFSYCLSFCFLSRKHSLLGASDHEAAKVDMVHAATSDIRSGPLSTPFRPLQQRGPLLAQHICTTLPKFLKPIDAMLAGSATGFVAGGGLTLADLTLFEAVKFNLDAPYVSPSWIDEYPAVVRHQQLVSYTPSVQSRFKNSIKRVISPTARPSVLAVRRNRYTVKQNP